MRTLSYLWEHAGEVAALTGQHAALVGYATLLAVLTAVPIGVAIARRPRWAGPVLALAGALMTVPSIALLGLLIPILATVGQGIGAVPTVIALVVYAQLPIIQNTHAAVAGIEPAVLEAARGMGMSRAELLWRVQLPLALPVILGGIRTAVVINVGVAAVAAYIGAGGLGHLIQLGLNALDDALVLAGALLLSALAVAAELLLGGAQRWLQPPGLRR
jgi:osmoprotectant transport system permease protein